MANSPKFTQPGPANSCPAWLNCSTYTVYKSSQKPTKAVARCQVNSWKHIFFSVISVFFLLCIFYIFFFFVYYQYFWYFFILFYIFCIFLIFCIFYFLYILYKMYFLYFLCFLYYMYFMYYLYFIYFQHFCTLVLLYSCTIELLYSFVFLIALRGREESMISGYIWIWFLRLSLAKI